MHSFLLGHTTMQYDLILKLIQENSNHLKTFFKVFFFSEAKKLDDKCVHQNDLVNDTELMK